MRHHAKRHNFHRRQGPRIALIRGLVYSLVEHGRIKTTLARAKETRRHAEKAITLAKKDGLHVRRLLLSRFPNEKVVDLMTGDLKKRFQKRAGGYTRIIKIGARPGDQADAAFLEFVDFTPEATTEKSEVKGDKGLKKRMRAKVAATTRHRKRVRTLQNEARRFERP